LLICAFLLLILIVPARSVRIYRNVVRKPLLDAFTAKYDARDVKIAMVGIWDTVGALGIPGNLFAGLDARLFGFLDTGLHPDVQSAYQALAVDERRNEFVPTLWTSAARVGF